MSMILITITLESTSTHRLKNRPSQEESVMAEPIINRFMRLGDFREGIGWKSWNWRVLYGKLDEIAEMVGHLIDFDRILVVTLSDT
jgi:hypothetical protein